ncbi:MAG: hypothetical protein V4597_05240, partial [Pseudomonadota bacterium]
MEFIGAGFLLLVGLAALVFGSAIAAAFEGGFGELGDVIGGLIVVVGIVMIGLGVLSLFIGLGLLKGRGWARITAIVLTILGALISLMSLVSGDFSQIISLALDGLMLYALFNPQTRAWFDHMAHQPGR